MKRHPHYSVYACLGSEITDADYRGKPIEPDSYYVTDAPGSKTLAGPFLSEARAMSEVELMADAGGT